MPPRLQQSMRVRHCGRTSWCRPRVTAVYVNTSAATLSVPRARCSSVARAFARGAIDHRIDPSWWTQRTISPSNQCSTTGVTKAVVFPILSTG